MKNLLLICKNSKISETLCRVLSNQSEYSVTSVTDIKELYVHLRRSHCDGVLLGSGLSDAEEEEVSVWIMENAPETRLIHHYGGGSGLLFNELKIAFEESKI